MKSIEMSEVDKISKRLFDIFFSIIGLIILWWIILLAFILASVDTKDNGFFIQTRVGEGGVLFKVIKIRTMRRIADINTLVTCGNDPRITKLGRLLRKAKIDELPQLYNVLIGDMSFVGPRPDVPGYADQLAEEDKRIILSVRPGITGPATLKYRNEEEILAEAADPEKYNKEVIYPDKVRLNKEYVLNYSFLKDLQYILMTIMGKSL